MECRSKLRFISFAIFNLNGVVKTRIRIRMWPWPRDITGLGLLTSRLVTSGKQRPVDAAQVVRPLVLVLDVWRLTDPDNFFDLSCPCLFSLSTTFGFCPLPIDDMVINLSNMICLTALLQMTFALIGWLLDWLQSPVILYFYYNPVR